MDYHFEKIDYKNFSEVDIKDYPNKSLFTTNQWYDFIVRDSKVVPIIIKIFKHNEHIGYFYAGEIKKFGIKIIASPFSGWSTCWMGFDTLDDQNKLDIVTPLSQYLFNDLRYFYAEIIDRDFNIDEVKRRGCICESFPTLELEINKTDEELFAFFKTDCRNFIRQFERRGATLEEAEPNDEFAEEYYEQLKDVFLKQGLTPSYGLQKVKNVMSTLGKTDKILCLRVRNPEGKSIATSIYFGFNTKFYFWGGASYREFQSYRPNEYMIWYAIKYWREKGCKVFDMVGDRSYKRKFGSTPVQYALIYLTKYPILIHLRNLAKKAYWMLLKIKVVLQWKKGA